MERLMKIITDIFAL
jgi:hypothetical protein